MSLPGGSGASSVRAVLAVLPALGYATVALRSRRALAQEVRPAHPRGPMSGERSR